MFPLALPAGFRVFDDLGALPDSARGGVVAVGNFDGVHRGHKAVIAAAREQGRPALAITLEPHPRTFFRPDDPLPRLTRLREKLALFAALGLDGALVLKFDAALAELSAERFARDILHEALAARCVVVGYDFHFGHDRAGSPAFLKGIAPELGFSAVVVPPLGNGSPISSSAIRSLLERGEIGEANRKLGHRWFVIGTVVKGDQRGRLLGYPTANIVLPADTPLAYGIYAVRVEIGGRVCDGVASFGSRPTFDDGAPRLEPFLFDFSGDLYGQDIAVEFVAYIRGEEKFDSAEALVARMDLDSIEARRLLSVPEDAQAPSLFEIAATG
jgi:riboflavin kinase/FMN adenylyltransferase